MRIFQIAENPPSPLKRQPIPKPDEDPGLGHYFVVDNLIHYPTAGAAVDPITGLASTLCGRELETKFGTAQELTWDHIPSHAKVCNTCYRRTLPFSKQEEDREEHTRKIQEGIATGNPKPPMPDLNREVSSVQEINRYRGQLRGHLARMDVTENEKQSIISKLNELEARLARWYSLKRRM